MESPFANLFESLIKRIEDKAPSIRHTTQDIGQLENYELRPAVSFPCNLIDIDAFNFSDVQNKHHQLAQGSITMRLGLVKYTDISSLTPEQHREAAMKFLEVEQEVFTAIHGWAPEGFSRCLRLSAVTERRDDDIRVRVLKFGLTFTDMSAEPKRQRVARPEPVIGDRQED